MTTRLLTLFGFTLTLTILACAHYPSGTEDDDAPDAGCTDDCPPDGGTLPPDGGTMPPDGGDPDGGTPTCETEGCPEGTTCQNGSCVPDEEPPTCETEGCPEGSTCQNGACVPDEEPPPVCEFACCADTDCAPGQVCESGTCVCDGDGDDGSDRTCASGKVLLCHYPPGHPAPPVEICVASSAVTAHQSHGDTLGACP